MDLAHANERADPAVAALLTASGIDPATVDLAVDRRDEMLAWALWAHHGCRQVALVNYFRSGLGAWRVVQHLLRWRFGARRDLRILDFAAGWGRVTRFMARDRPPASLWVGEIDPAALAFQRARFGVHGVPSSSRPEELAVEGRFDAVVAASLFSHLPPPTFEPWLARLWSLVAPGGLLAFSVHDEAVMLPGRAMPAAGIYFEEVSESPSLDRRDYGSTWVRESYVAAALGRVAGGRASYRRLPRGLWHHQDLYAVVPEPGADFAGLAPAGEPEGYLDRCAIDAAGDLRLGGWAIDRASGGPAARVEIALGGGAAAAAVGEERADVAAFAGEGFRRSGWTASPGPAAAFGAGDLLVVEAVGAGGARAVVHASALEVAALYVALARDRAELTRAGAELERAAADLRGVRVALGHESARVGELDRRVHELGWEAHVLRSRIAAMEASRFWKLRERWFALKRRFGKGPRPV
jgi:SAM-dependent methyltransferase